MTKNNLSDPIEGASIAFFRISFGLVLCWEVWRYFHYDWIARYYVTPVFHFSYLPIDWLTPWTGQGMYWHFGLMGLLAFFIAVGFCYRASAILFWLAFTYVFLLQNVTQHLSVVVHPGYH